MYELGTAQPQLVSLISSTRPRFLVLNKELPSSVKIECESDAKNSLETYSLAVGGIKERLLSVCDQFPWPMSVRGILLLLLLSLLLGPSSPATRKGSFWSKRDTADGLSGPGEQWTREFKRSSNNKINLKGFPVLPFSTMIRKPFRSSRAAPSLYLDFSFFEFGGPRLQLRGTTRLENKEGFAVSDLMELH